MFLYFVQADSDVYACTSNNEVVRSRNTMGNTNDASQPLVSCINHSIKYLLKEGSEGAIIQNPLSIFEANFVYSITLLIWYTFLIAYVFFKSLIFNLNKINTELTHN